MTTSFALSEQENFAAWAALHDAVAESPRRYPVNDWCYRHPLATAADPAMDLWPIIKILYMVGACHQVHAGVPTKPLAPRVPSARRAVASAPPPTKMQWPSLDCEVLMLGSSVGNHALDGYLAQHHLDPLREALSRRGLRSTTLLTDVAPKAPQLDHTLLGQTLGAAPVLLAVQSHLPPGGDFALSELPGFEAWHAEISALYPLDGVLDRQTVVEIVEKIYSTAYCLRRYFAQHALKAVIGYAYYGVVGLAAAFACRTLGIPFFDMQHGSAGRHHHCYAWPDMPAGGYNNLPSHFLCWSAIEANAIESCAVSSGPTAVAVGHSWRLMEQLLQTSSAGMGIGRCIPLAVRDHYAAQCADAVRRKAATAAAGLTTVLLTLRADEDIAWLEPLLSAANQPFRVLIRLHPAESRDREKLARRVAAFETPTAEVTRPSRAPMSVLLRECDVHLTGYSSSILDARAFGVPSLCYAWSSRWFYSPDQYQQVEMVAPQANAVRDAVLALCAARPTSSNLPATLSLNEIGTLLAREILRLRAAKLG